MPPGGRRRDCVEGSSGPSTLKHHLLAVISIVARKESRRRAVAYLLDRLWNYWSNYWSGGGNFRFVLLLLFY